MSKDSVQAISNCTRALVTVDVDLFDDTASYKCEQNAHEWRRSQSKYPPLTTIISHLTKEEGRKEIFYLTTHSTHFIYGYMASDIWLRAILIVREETRGRHIGYSFRLAARVLLYAPSHRQDSTYHGLCYTSRGALATKEEIFYLCKKWDAGV